MSSYSNSKRSNQHNGGNFSARQYFKDNLRVLRRNLLFCSGLPLTLTEPQLKSDNYFGKYGRVIRITQLKNMRQMSVYVTYSDSYQASLAIIATNDFELDRYHKLASIYGTIKYCKYFLKKIECKNLPNCNYLHVYDKKNQIYINNQLPDEVFEQHYAIAMRVFNGVDVKMLIKQKRLKANSGMEDILPCPIQTLQHIIKQRKNYISSSRSQSSQQQQIILSSNKQLYDHQSGQQQQSLSSPSSEQDKDVRSQEGTSETIILETIERDPAWEEFPKLGNEKGKKERYREKGVGGKKHQGNINNYITLLQQQSPATTISIQQQPLTISPLFVSNLPHPFSPNSQTLQIKLIRRLLRQPTSKINSWRRCEQQQLNSNIQPEIELFHKQLSELNQLRELCESNILREKSMEEERVKFLLIKNIHYNKKHCHIPHHHHVANRGHVVQ